MNRPINLSAESHRLSVEMTVQDMHIALRMTDDELDRYIKHDLTRALAESITDKFPMHKYVHHGYQKASMTFYAVPQELFWEIVRREAREMLNRAVGYPTTL